MGRGGKDMERSANLGGSLLERLQCLFAPRLRTVLCYVLYGAAQTCAHSFFFFWETKLSVTLDGSFDDSCDL